MRNLTRRLVLQFLEDVEALANGEDVYCGALYPEDEALESLVEVLTHPYNLSPVEIDMLGGVYGDAVA